jgi:hypothetical protein
MGMFKLLISCLGAWVFVAVFRALMIQDTGSPAPAGVSVAMFLALWALFHALWDGDSQ